jgi:hypothetical protein
VQGAGGLCVQRGAVSVGAVRLRLEAWCVTLLMRARAHSLVLHAVMFQGACQHTMCQHTM